MPRYKKIYESQAATYDELVAREDYQGNILPALAAVCPLGGIDVVEFGAGTGRLTALLAPLARGIRAFDSYPAMIEHAKGKFEGMRNVSFDVADNRSLPVEDGCCALSLAGWTLGHATSWNPDGWKEEVRQVIKEMLRVVSEQGFAVILETLGTGQDAPAAPNARLANYYEMLETELGFQRKWIRTDYRFSSAAEAKALTGAFFGTDYRFRDDSSGSVFLPECTGIWHRTREG